MQFRSPTEKPIRVAQLSGHIAMVGNKWRDLPAQFHEDAVAAGCERREGDEGESDLPALVKRPAPQAGPNAMAREAGTDDHYRTALKALLERSAEGDFTKDSLPNINAVSKLCGFAAVKEDVLRVFRAMKEEAGVAEPKAS